MNYTQRVAIRDASLRKRLDDAVTASRGMINMSQIIRTALDEKLTQIERQGISKTLAKLLSAKKLKRLGKGARCRYKLSSP